MRAETRQSTAAAAGPPASEPPPPKPNFEPEDRPKKEPTKPEAFLARQRQLGSLGGKCAGSVGENKFLVEVAVDGRARCQLRTCKEPLKIGELRLGEAAAVATGVEINTGDEPPPPRHRASVA